jgi:succinate-acetate transporter protein
MEATTSVRHTTNGEGVIPEQRGAMPPVAPAIGDPAPLGLAAFALTTFVLSFFNAGLVSDKGLPVVLGLALAYGGIAQLLAGMWEFRNNNTFGATAFTSFGAFWISWFVLEQFQSDKIPAANLGAAVGLYLIAWGIFTSYMWIASFRVSAAVNLVFLLLAITFIVLGIGEANGTDSIVKAGGWIGIATAIAAWYASFASVTNKTFGRIVLPVHEFK